MEDNKTIESQEGFQKAFHSSPADIVIGGGAAGAGKSYALLMDPMRYFHIPNFGAVIFRRTTPQITNEGSLWDTASELYPLIGGTGSNYKLRWDFPIDGSEHTARVRFQHLEYEKNKHDHQGGQYPYIGFDELQQFTKTQFLYLLSRNRTSIGMRPCIRATCNPDPDSWLAEFIDWWIDQQSGFPIPERSGVLRYFTTDGGNFVWGDTKKEVIEKAPHVFNALEFDGINKEDLVKSITFIPGSIFENKKFIQADPGYLGNLLGLPEEEQLRLLKGNWKYRQDGSSLFNFQRINDLFSNFLEDDDFKCITVDYARFGQDLTVIKSWVGFIVVRIEVMTKSSTVEAFDVIEKERERFKVPRSSVIVDDDGVGGGVVDQSGGEYISFHANASPVLNPLTKDKEEYKNLKTQCYYMLADKVNKAEVRIYTNNIIVDGEITNELRRGQNVYSIEKLIKDELRAIKRKNMDKEGKRQINTKEEQKIILGGRSPDFADTLMMRLAFSLSPVTITSDDVFFG